MTQFTIEDTTPLRLDKFIRRECFYLPQGIIEKHLRLGDVKVNGAKAKSSVRLKKGDVVTVSDKLQQMASSKNEPTKLTNFSPAVISLGNKMLKEYLILESEDFIAINKPFGLATQGGSKINISVDHALAYLNDTQKTEYRLVHRLDKDTSGVLIIAKNLNSCMKLGDAFKTKELQKTYLAVVWGVPNPQFSSWRASEGGVAIHEKTKETLDGHVALRAPRHDGLKGEIENYIGKDRSGSYDLVTETPDGKLAKTLYEVVSHDKNVSTIKYMPQTGRMHQLRFHSKQLGCPILGDIKYGGKPFDRMMLHAWQITIPASIFGQEYNIVAPWDKFFEKYVSEPR